MFGITRSTTDRQVLGILGGIAERFNINSKILRIVFMIGVILTFGTLITSYFVLMLLIPNEERITRRSPSGRPMKKAKKVS